MVVGFTAASTLAAAGGCSSAAAEAVMSFTTSVPPSAAEWAVLAANFDILRVYVLSGFTVIHEIKNVKTSRDTALHK